MEPLQDKQVNIQSRRKSVWGARRHIAALPMARGFSTCFGFSIATAPASLYNSQAHTLPPRHYACFSSRRIIVFLTHFPSWRVFRPVVFLGPFEHHSNILPWKESHADVVTIKEDAAGGLDLNDLQKKLKIFSRRRLKIGTYSAISPRDVSLIT